MKTLLFVISIFAPLVALAQFKDAKIEFFAKGSEDVKVTGLFHMSEPLDDPVLLEFKGGEKNVWYRISWPKPLAENASAKIVVIDDRGQYCDGLEPKFIPKGTSKLEYPFTLTPGSYRLQLLKNSDGSVIVERAFTVFDKIGERATGNQKADQAEFWICQTVDDDWKPVGGNGDQKKRLFTWPAKKSFEVLVKNNHKPFNVSFLGIVIHKQGEDGKDTDFVSEWQTDMLDDKSTMWCTQGGLPGLNGLPAGKYTIYVIDWSERQPTEHTGNLKEFFSKATLIVKD